MPRTPARKAATEATTTKGRRIARYVLLALGVLFILDAFVGEKGLVEIVKARQDYRRLEASLARVRTENGRLRERARLLREDADTVERVAREQLGLIRPGERLFILKDVTPAKP
jgi:cell division protein FtsB